MLIETEPRETMRRSGQAATLNVRDSGSFQLRRAELFRESLLYSCNARPYYDISTAIIHLLIIRSVQDSLFSLFSVNNF